MSKTEQKSSEVTPKESIFKSKLSWILAILLVAAVSGCGFFYWQYTKANDKDPQAQQRRWTAELNKVLVTPDETPVITTVLDKSKLTNQALAAQAANGDRLYIYSNAKRLVLYRPSQQKVVDMLTIQTGQPEQAGQSGQTPQTTQVGPTVTPTPPAPATQRP